MSPVNTVGQVFEAIQKVKAGAAAFCTNFFPVQRKLQGWIDHGEFFGELRDGSAFFMRKDRDFWHLYFCAASVTALQREMPLLPDLRQGRVVVDLVGDEAALSDLLGLMESAGFRRYRRLYRMARASQPVPRQSRADEVQPACAGRADCDAILELLCRSFDRYAEQLPMLYEIEAAVESGQILVAKRGEALAGLLFFETQGFTSTIRYWLVADGFRALRCGSALMRHYFAIQSAVRRFVLWVIADNEDAIRKYQHYGFAPDKLVDHVLANEMIHV
jgi:hypothetical protein